MRVGIHIFRKDLRVIDNKSLYLCADTCDKILGVFIIDPIQTSNANSKYYRSYNALRFIFESLDDLDNAMHGCLWICTERELLKYIMNHRSSITTISTNKDYTEYAISRDNRLRERLANHGIEWITTDDQFLLSESITKPSGDPYIVFSYFYKNALRYKVDAPSRKTISWMKPPKSKDIKQLLSVVANNASPIQITHGGRSQGLIILHKSKTAEKATDTITTESGTHIAPYINFGCLSSREAYAFWKIARKDSIRQLYWRDFFLTIIQKMPIARKYQWMDSRYNKIRWRTKREYINEWTAMWESRTGFHLIDAATRQLRESGYLPNRARILWAWFCIKLLQINPFDKEYGALNIFSRLLVDAMTSQNKLNFEWIISSLDVGGRRYSRGPPLAGRYVDISNVATRKYHAQEWIRHWLTDEELQQPPIFDIKKRYQQWIKMIKDIQ